MQRDDDAGEALDEMARLRPALDRLRELVTWATILDLKATSRGYWTERRRESGPGTPERRPAV